MTPTVKEAIKELKDKEVELIAEAAAVRQAYLALEVSICPVQPGDVVVYQHEQYLVRAIDRAEYCWVWGSSLRKDGRWSNARKRLFGDMTVVEKADA